MYNTKRRHQHTETLPHSHNKHKHEHIFKEELMHHLPYALFSVALAIVGLSFLDYSSAASTGSMRESACHGYNMLFHVFHFLHILFAATGTVITFSRFSNNFIKCLIVGTLSPIFFCVLSDIVLPNLAGRLLGVEMDLHICFHREIHNVFPFLLGGFVNGFVLSKHHSAMLSFFSLGSHFTHILISSLASLFYMVSHGFTNWYDQMGYLYLALVFAIVIPCTFSDVIVPLYFAYNKKRVK